MFCFYKHFEDVVNSKYILNILSPLTYRNAEQPRINEARVSFRKTKPSQCKIMYPVPGSIAVDLRLEPLTSVSSWQDIFSVHFEEQVIIHTVTWRTNLRVLNRYTVNWEASLTSLQIKNSHKECIILHLWQHFERQSIKLEKAGVVFSAGWCIFQRLL